MVLWNVAKNNLGFARVTKYERSRFQVLKNCKQKLYYLLIIIIDIIYVIIFTNIFDLINLYINVRRLS
jgi:hypothetical protein